MAVRNLSEMHMTSRDALILDSMHLIKLIVNKYKNYAKHMGFDLDDLFSIGSIGLIKAIDQYDPKKGYEFEFYCLYVIRGEVHDYLGYHGELIRIPRRVWSTHKAIMQNWLENLPAETIATMIGREVTLVKKALKFIELNRVEYLDKPSINASGKSYENSWLTPKSTDDLTLVEVKEFLSSLSPTERKVVNSRMKRMKSGEIVAETGLHITSVSRIAKGVGKKYLKQEFKKPSIPAKV